MQFQKMRLVKQFLLVATGLILSSVAVKQANSRDNESLKPQSKTGFSTGIASWYHDKFHGRKTANGDIFSQKKLTCASNLYPLGTWLKVTNLRTLKSVFVMVNDRMSPKVKRVVDLSRAAARQIGIEKSGVGKVKVENMGSEKPTNA